MAASLASRGGRGLRFCGAAHVGRGGLSKLVVAAAVNNEKLHLRPQSARMLGPEAM